MTLTSSACPEPFDCLAGAQDKLGPWPSRGRINLAYGQVEGRATRAGVSTSLDTNGDGST